MPVELIYIIRILFLLIGLGSILFFKSHFLKIVLFVLWYPLVPMFLFWLGIPLGGSIDVIGRQYNEGYANSAFILALFAYFVFLATLWSIRKENILIKRINYNDSSRILLLILLLFVSIIGYPKAFGIGNARWGLIPGPWPVFFIVLNTLLLLSIKKTYSVISYLHILILLIVLAGGERANSILALLMLFLVQETEDGLYLEEKKFKKSWIIGGALIFILAIGSGIARNHTQLSGYILLHNIFAQHTATDVIHVYFSSFYYLDHFGNNYMPLVNEFMSIVPLSPLGGAACDVNFTEIIREKIYNYGGGLFYTEGVLVIGKVGVIFYAFIFGMFNKWSFKQKNQIGGILIVLLITLQLRIQWYGLVYFYTPFIFCFLIIGVVNLLLRKEWCYDKKKNRFS